MLRPLKKGVYSSGVYIYDRLILQCNLLLRHSEVGKAPELKHLPHKYRGVAGAIVIVYSP